MIKPPRATIDFESRSACPLRNTGSWRYSLDPSTEPLCLAFRLPSWEVGRTGLWHPAFPQFDMLESSGTDDDDLCELLEWIQAGGLVEAHNAWFERGIWTNIMAARYGWPEIQPSQWRCSAAKAAAHSLPRSLDGVTEALELDIRKDLDGSKVMKKISKPRKARKAERERWARHGLAERRVWHESKAMLETLFAYCRQDVLAEEAVSEYLDDLTPLETQVYLMDQSINERGFQLDPEAVSTALTLIGKETIRLNKELATVTGGLVKKATQRAQMIEWFATEGLRLMDTQKETIDELLVNRQFRKEITADAWRGLEIMRTLGRSSTAKYQAMRNWMCPDGRVRGGLLYHGAGTGRWSGSGVQPHNFPKGTVKADKLDALWPTLKARKRAFIESEYGGVMEALANALRGAIVAAPGKRLYVADYAAIEARVVLWLADDKTALGIFERHEDIYKDMASDIYGIPMIEVTGDQRQHGKQAVLGCGYQMGWSKFQATCEKYEIILDDEMAQRIVTAYREKYWRVVNMWRDQEKAALDALRYNRPVKCGKVTWKQDGDFLYCVLPSGRKLAYPHPEIHARDTPWGEPKPSLTFMGINPYTRKWSRQTTYGGMLVENITQAVARDLMAEAMLRCEASDTYQVVLSVHDELVAEADEMAGNVQEFEQLMAECPAWAKGCPVEAAGWTGIRYRK